MPPLPELRRRRSSDAERQQADEVSDALRRQDRRRLEELAYSPLGFGTVESRRAAWLFLLGVDPRDAADSSWRRQLAGLQEEAPEAKVMQADVQRSVFSWDVHTGLGERTRDRKRVLLSEVMHAILQKHRGHLRYFQGFHDIVLVFLELGSPSQAFHMAERLALFQLSDQLCCPFDRGLLPLLGVLFHLLTLVDRQLASALLEADCGELHFAVPWVLTFFAHTLPKLHQVMRLFDCLLCSHPAAILYFSAALLILHRDEVLQTERDLPEMVCTIQAWDFSRLDAESWARLSQRLMRQVPPAELLLRLPPPRQLALPATSPLRHYPHPWTRPEARAFDGGSLSRMAPVFTTAPEACGSLFGTRCTLWVLQLKRAALGAVGLSDRQTGGLLAMARVVSHILGGLGAIAISAQALAAGQANKVGTHIYYYLYDRTRGTRHKNRRALRWAVQKLQAERAMETARSAKEGRPTKRSRIGR